MTRAHSATLDRFMQYPSMEPQPCCSLPWCGRSFAGPLKRYHVTDHLTGEKRTVEYPAGIDAHHVMEEKVGPVVYLCHECHMKHESSEPLSFDYYDSQWHVAREDGLYAPLFVHNPYADSIPVETEEVLDTLAQSIRELKFSADQMDYFLSRELAEAEKKLKGDRKQLAEWCIENLDISPRSVDSYLSKRISYASLPESCSTLGITNGYKVWQLSQKYPLDEVLADYTSMSRSQFNEQYGLTKHRTKCECPVCGATHSAKEE